MEPFTLTLLLIGIGVVITEVIYWLLVKYSIENLSDYKECWALVKLCSAMGTGLIFLIGYVIKVGIDEYGPINWYSVGAVFVLVLGIVGYMWANYYFGLGVINSHKKQISRRRKR